MSHVEGGSRPDPLLTHAGKEPDAKSGIVPQESPHPRALRGLLEDHLPVKAVSQIVVVYADDLSRNWALFALAHHVPLPHKYRRDMGYLCKFLSALHDDAVMQYVGHWVGVLRSIQGDEEAQDSVPALEAWIDYLCEPLAQAWKLGQVPKAHASDSKAIGDLAAQITLDERWEDRMTLPAFLVDGSPAHQINCFVRRVAISDVERPLRHGQTWDAPIVVCKDLVPRSDSKASPGPIPGLSEFCVNPKNPDVLSDGSVRFTYPVSGDSLDISKSADPLHGAVQRGDIDGINQRFADLRGMADLSAEVATEYICSVLPHLELSAESKPDHVFHALAAGICSLPVLGRLEREKLILRMLLPRAAGQHQVLELCSAVLHTLNDAEERRALLERMIPPHARRMGPFCAIT